MEWITTTISLKTCLLLDHYTCPMSYQIHVVNPRMIVEGYMEAMSKRMGSAQENMPRTWNSQLRKALSSDTQGETGGSVCRSHVNRQRWWVAFSFLLPLQSLFIILHLQAPAWPSASWPTRWLFLSFLHTKVWPWRANPHLLCWTHLGLCGASHSSWHLQWVAHLHFFFIILSLSYSSKYLEETEVKAWHSTWGILPHFRSLFLSRLDLEGLSHISPIVFFWEMNVIANMYFSLSFTCVCAHVCTCMCMCMVHSWEYAQSREGGLLSATLNLVTLRQSVSLNWKLALWLGWLESQFLGFHLSLASQSCRYRHGQPCQAFYMGAGDSNSGPHW